jgi:hypothetical protein
MKPLPLPASAPGAMAGAASAPPERLSEAELDQVTGGICVGIADHANRSGTPQYNRRS